MSRPQARWLSALPRLERFRASVVAASLLLVALSLPAQAQVFLGPGSISSGTHIKVLEPGVDLNALIDAITDADAANPYLVQLGPGVYSVSAPLELKPFVSLAGSGEDVTIVRGEEASGFSSGGVVRLALSSTLSHLSVENVETTGTSIVAVVADQLDSEGDASTTRLLYVTARAAGSPSATSRGVHLESSSIRVEHLTAEVTGTNINYGVRLYNSRPILDNVRSSVSGGTANRAFYISESASDGVLSATTAVAEGSSSYGYYVSDGAAPTILRSSLQGTSGALLNQAGSTVTVLHSVLEGGVSGTGTFQCFSNSDQDANALDAVCE